MGLPNFFDGPDDIVSLLDKDEGAAVPASTKIGATLGPASHDTDTLEALLKAGMSVARIDLSSQTTEFHLETLSNLREAQQRTKKICAVMVDTHGPELQVENVPKDANWNLAAGDSITLTTDLSKPASAASLPLAVPSFAGIPAGSSIFIGQYLFTGAETTSAYLTLESVTETTATCKCTNDCTLTGASRLTVHVSNGGSLTDSVLVDVDHAALSSWARDASIDYLALSGTRSAADVAEARAALDKNGLTDTKIIAKLETKEGVANHTEIIEAADGIVFSRGLLGLEIEAEKMFKVQKMLLTACNMAGKPVFTTRVIDTMSSNPRPTRAEATDIANLVLDGVDGILLGSETFRGSFPVGSLETTIAICKQAERCFNNAHFYDAVIHYNNGKGSVMPKAEALASSAVRAASKLDAKLIIVFTVTGRTARMIAKYKPGVPILAVIPSTQEAASASEYNLPREGHPVATQSIIEEVVVPNLSHNGIKWSLSGGAQARQVCALRGVIPLLADPSVKGAAEGSMAGYAMLHASKLGLVSEGDRVVISQCPRHAVPSGPMSEAGVLKIATVEEKDAMVRPRRIGTMDNLANITV